MLRGATFLSSSNYNPHNQDLPHHIHLGEPLSFLSYSLRGKFHLLPCCFVKLNSRRIIFLELSSLGLTVIFPHINCAPYFYCRQQPPSVVIGPCIVNSSVKKYKKKNKITCLHKIMGNLFQNCRKFPKVCK